MVERRARVISAAIFAGLLTIVVGAGLTWACTGPSFGTPATPGNPPAPSPDAGVGTPTAPAPQPAAPAAPTATPAPTTGTSGATVTSGARSAPRTTSGARGNTGATVRRGVATVPNTVARTQFTQRESGATAGVTRSDGRAVFANPAAKAKAGGADRAARSVPSARSASGDLWNGFKPESRSSVFAAEASAPQGGGSPVTVALLALGLGVTGLAGSAMVLGLRRRKAHSRAAGSSSKTE